jgi:predicted aspartyl protease
MNVNAWRPATRALSAAATLHLMLGAASVHSGPDPQAVTPFVIAPPVIEEVQVSAPEPRYVSPTLRDRIGRIWVPVFIDGQGPLRLVLDTGATRSALTHAAVARLGLEVDPKRTVMLRGTTGSARAPIVKARTVEVGDLLATRQTLVVVDDAFGGAEGVLATTALADRRILADFKRDRIEITRSKGRTAPPGFTVLPIKLLDRYVPWVEATVGGVRVKAVIDTGSQQTIGTPALRAALITKRREMAGRDEDVIGVTGDVQAGRSVASPRILLGNISVRNARINFVDLPIFERWRLSDEPALLIGMDVLGVLDTLVIDYHRRELQIRSVTR